MNLATKRFVIKHKPSPIMSDPINLNFMGLNIDFTLFKFPIISGCCGYHAQVTSNYAGWPSNSPPYSKTEAMLGVALQKDERIAQTCLHEGYHMLHTLPTLEKILAILRLTQNEKEKSWLDSFTTNICQAYTPDTYNKAPLERCNTELDEIIAFWIEYRLEHASVVPKQLKTTLIKMYSYFSLLRENIDRLYYHPIDLVLNTLDYGLGKC